MKIGLNAEQLSYILLEGIDADKQLSASALRDAIAKAIEKNNEQLLKDIQSLLT